VNTNCPGCDAVYNVASKDIGRKLKCKKCGMALKVTDAGLEEDRPGGAPASDPKPVPAAAAVADDDEEDEPVVKKGKGSKYSRGPGVNPLAALAGIGGVPTILFGFGAFLVIVYLFMPLISVAAESRADGGVDQLEQEARVEARKKLPKGKTSQRDLTPEEATAYNAEVTKINEKYQPKITEAKEAVEDARISRKRSLWFDRYGMMFGFIFLMFGSLGYLLNPEPGIRRIVGAIVLMAQIIMIFLVFGAGGCVGTVGDGIKGLGGLK
jgi:predicted Zn finger-like uncharacterized protein